MTQNTKKILRWSPTNPNNVERAYRKGFLLGARCVYLLKEDEIMDLVYDLFGPPSEPPYSILRDDDLDNTSTAFIRGFFQAVMQVTSWITDGGSRENVKKWQVVVYEWAHEFPLSKEESAALPPPIGKWTWNELVRHYSNSKANRRDQGR